MKLEVLNWFSEFSKQFLGKTIEIVFRILLLCLPLWVYLVLIQLRDKPSKISSISVYTKDESVWQHVFPGFLLVAIKPKAMQESWIETKRNVQMWVDKNKYILALVFMSLVVMLMIVKGN